MEGSTQSAAAGCGGRVRELGACNHCVAGQRTWTTLRLEASFFSAMLLGGGEGGGLLHDATEAECVGWGDQKYSSCLCAELSESAAVRKRSRSGSGSPSAHASLEPARSLSASSSCFFMFSSRTLQRQHRSGTVGIKQGEIQHAAAVAACCCCCCCCCCLLLLLIHPTAWDFKISQHCAAVASNILYRYSVGVGAV